MRRPSQARYPAPYVTGRGAKLSHSRSTRAKEEVMMPQRLSALSMIYGLCAVAAELSDRRTRRHPRGPAGRGLSGLLCCTGRLVVPIHLWRKPRKLLQWILSTADCLCPLPSFRLSFRRPLGTLGRCSFFTQRSRGKPSSVSRCSLAAFKVRKGARYTRHTCPCHAHGLTRQLA
jgi:hypothetical protein